jgi:hypothetical protein
MICQFFLKINARGLARKKLLTLSVVLCQKIASMKVAATGGVRKLEIDWM